MAGRLGDILVSNGLISDEQLQSVLQSGHKGMLGEALVARGLGPPEYRARALPCQYVSSDALSSSR